MKFKIDPKILKEELSFLSNVTEKDLTVALSNVLIESVSDNRIRIQGTNLETSVQTEIDAKVEKEGKICINGKKLLGIVKVLQDEMSFEKDKNSWIIIKSKASRFRLPGFNESLFPKISILEDSIATIDAKKLSKMIKATAFAMNLDESRFALGGVKLEIKNGLAKMVATDGHRISYIEQEADGNLDVLIPKRCLPEASKLPEGLVDLSDSLNQVYFKSNERYLTSGKLVGAFPEYQRMFNTENYIDFKVKKSDLLNSIEKVSLMSDIRTHSMRFTISKNKLKLSTISTEEGEGEDAVDIIYEGEESILNLNWVYIKEFLVNCEVDDLIVRFKDSKNPVHIGYDEGNYKYVVMPLIV